ncbi:MAG: hypothetical protein U5P10_00095 [Spirochaetia bacterium]|nr:hypothetical protein [Spirochaetia bacterium]
MADSLSLISIQRTAALTRVKEYFSAQGDFELQSIDSEIGEKFKGCEIWKGCVISDEQSWPIYIIFGKNFPIEPPVVYSPKAESLYLENPHVLEGGFLLCFFSAIPPSVAKYS